MTSGIPTFDLEAINMANPIAAGFFDGLLYHDFLRKDMEDDVLWRFLTFLKQHYRGIKLYGHYASKYDNKLLLACLCKHDQEIALENTKK